VAKNATVAGIRTVARAPEELLLTFAGFGLYFRFVYSPCREYLEYGWWSNFDAGKRQYIPTGEWRITREGIKGFTGVEGADEIFYPALDAVMRSLEWGTDHMTYRSSAYALRDMVPDAVAPPSPPGP
jgi:hypothetical protein